MASKVAIRAVSSSKPESLSRSDNDIDSCESSDQDADDMLSQLEADKQTCLQATADAAREHDPLRNDLLPRATFLKTSYLRPGCRFEGSQQSGRSTYEVEVEIKNVDLNQGFMCGYFKIDGLSDHHPTLVTYFQGEIISDKHSFLTKRPLWGANEKTDISHWSRFAPWRTLESARDPHYVHSEFLSSQYIFMRWKERFLVPDHTVRELANASYAGFYYIMFNQVNGVISGYYFHENSDKFQQLDLSPCENERHTMQQPTYEFR